MENDQVEKRIAWLDEQRRKDAQTVGQFTDKLKGIEEAIKKQTRQLQDVSSEVARLSGLVARVNQFDESLSKHRQEVGRQLDGFVSWRDEREKHAEKVRKTDQEEVNKRLDSLKVELSRLDGLEQSLAVRQEEEIRITRDFDALKKKLDEIAGRDEDRGRSIQSLEESRKQDSRRVTDLQSETSDLRARIDTVRGSLDAVEDRARRLESRLTELSGSENERREAQSSWMEQQALKLSEFEREWKDWTQRFDAFEARASELDQRMLSYEETYRGLKALREELEGVIERLERRINEISEMQRLAEDRQKQEWATFQADDQKRWNTYKLTHDEQWREHNRAHEKITMELRALDESARDVLQNIAELSQVSQQRIMDLLAVVRDWAAEVEASSGGRG